MKTLETLFEQSKGNMQQRVVVPFPHECHLIQMMIDAVHFRMASFTLIGETEKIKDFFHHLNQPIDESFQFIESSDPIQACDLAVKMVANDQAQILMKGMVQTSTFSKAFLKKEYHLIPPGKTISHVALFQIPTYHKLLIVTDSALNIKPSVRVKKQILSNAINFAIALGIQYPKVACICPNEKINPNIQSCLDAEEIVKCALNGEFSPAIVDGPFGLDIAVSANSAKIKNINSPVAGDADILLLPELNSANVLYKAITEFTNARVASIIQGAKIPIVLASRTESKESKLYSLAAGLCISSH